MTEPFANRPMEQEFKNQSLALLDQSMIKIRNCFQQLSDAQVWWVPPGTTNSLGNLVLHCCGNLRQWGVNGILQRPDDREREQEFSADNHYRKDQLLELCDTTIDEARRAIEPLAATDLMSPRTIQGFQVTVLQAILHTSTHFVGHTHQIILLTRQQLGANYQFAWQPDTEQDDLPI
ncbi:MAG: DUF1572 domain-containing protein [Mariniblastus sp.]|nr:DUF1572 domain-containing protein [Mariniblastus sp.]